MALKVFVIVDMEGATGVVHRDQLLPEGRTYEAARWLLTADVNAAIEGVLEVEPGAEFLVNDGHGVMRNVVLEQLHEQADLILGSASFANRPLCQCTGVDDSYDLALLVGFHSMAGSGGLLAHTFVGSTICNFGVNGETVGEVAVDAAVLGAFGIPVGLVVGNDDRSVVALTPAGQVRWKRELGQAVDSSPLVDDAGNVYASADGLWALDPAGEVRWHLPLAGHVRSSPALHPEGFLVVGTADGRVFAVGTDGEPRWEAPVGASVDGSASIADDGTIYVGNDRGDVVALGPDGTLRWHYETGGDVRATPAIAPDGTIVVGSYDRHVYALSPDGELKWRTETSGRVRASARIDAAGRIYVGSQDDFFYALSSDGRVLWRHDVGQDVDSTAAIAADGTLYVGSDDGRLYALR